MLQCCIPPDFVVQINNFFTLVLFFAEINKSRGKKLISKTIRYNLNSSLKMQLPFFILKTFKTFFWKTISFAESLEYGAGWGFMCMEIDIYDSPIRFLTILC